MNKLITVFGLCYNEELMLPYFISHYRKMFPDCRIVLWDNESTDKTHEIAIANNCEIVLYSTAGKLNDVKYLELKNNAWKTALTDWVLVCDMDEFVDIDERRLSAEEETGSTLVRFEGWNMTAINETLNPTEIKTAIRAESYDKSYLFNKRYIEEINYSPGAHKADPKGLVRLSVNTYRCFHYKYLNLEYMIKRHAHFAARLSDENKAKGYGGHYQYTRQRITKEFTTAQRNAIKILW